MSYEDDALMEALVRAAHRGDWSLDRLLDLADVGLVISISLLVDGRWIEGELARPEDWAQELDANVDAAFGTAADRTGRETGPITDPSQLLENTPTVGDIEQLRATMRTHSFRDVVDTRRAQEAQIRAEFDALQDGEKTPDDLARAIDAMNDPTPVITLRAAVIEGRVRERHLAAVRVIRSSVAAWHLGRATTYEPPA